MQQPAQPSLQPLQQLKPVNGSKPSPQPQHSSLPPPSVTPAGGAMTAAAAAAAGLASATSSFQLHQSRLNSRLQAVFSASSELLLSEDGNVARLYEALEQWYLVSDQSLLHLMDADALLTVYESEPYQSSLPLSLSSLLPHYHTPPAQLMQQQWQAMDKMRLRHQLLAAVSADYLPQPASPPAPDSQLLPASSLASTFPPAVAEQSPSMPALSSPPLPSSPPVVPKEEEKARERERAQEINLVDDEPTAQQTPAAAAAAPQAAGEAAMELESAVSAPETMQEARSVMDLTNS